MHGVSVMAAFIRDHAAFQPVVGLRSDCAELGYIVTVRVGGPARKTLVAVKQRGKRARRLRPRLSDVNESVQPRYRLHETAFHGKRGVQKHDRLVVTSADVSEQRLLFGRNFEKVTQRIVILRRTVFGLLR